MEASFAEAEDRADHDDVAGQGAGNEIGRRLFKEFFFKISCHRLFYGLAAVGWREVGEQAGTYPEKMRGVPGSQWAAVGLPGRL